MVMVTDPWAFNLSPHPLFFWWLKIKVGIIINQIPSFLLSPALPLFPFWPPLRDMVGKGPLIECEIEQEKPCSHMQRGLHGMAQEVKKRLMEGRPRLST